MKADREYQLGVGDCELTFQQGGDDTLRYCDRLARRDVTYDGGQLVFSSTRSRSPH